MMGLLLQFVLAVFATLGFAIIFRVPVRHMVPCVVVGALGWVTYEVTLYCIDSASVGCFVAACAVGLLSTVCAYVFKDASTIFVIPGILCLVPGSKIFQTMEALLLHEMENAAEIGLQTLMMAGSIAIGLLTVGAVSNIAIKIVKKLRTIV
ncbi:MAG: threonine/serine exporter family protein [Firmicutes bacterium]|nr:threonine/serine exporter family protein [Bacillota bacterium]